MKYAHFTTSLLGFLLLFGAIFFAQCDTDTRSGADNQYSEEQIPQTDMDEEDRSYDGTGTQGTDTDQGFTGDIISDRDQLVADIEELNDRLSDELSDRSNITEEQAEQIENDRTDLGRILREIQVAEESNWDNVHEEALQTYEQVSARYEQRVNSTMGRN